MAKRKTGSEDGRKKPVPHLWIFLAAACLVTLVPDLQMDREAHLGIDDLFGFHALFGFTSCAVLIILAKAVGIFLKVTEDYYE